MTETLTHEDVSLRLIDLVYDEAPADERAALEAHVAGCARCQAELAALGGTRALVRGALVAEPAPKRVHAKLLEAATEAVAPVAAAAAARAPMAAAPAPRAAPEPASSTASWWQRMRAGWTLPTFATVGAFAILLLASKVLLDPARTYERGRQAAAPAAPAAAPAVMPAREEAKHEERRRDEPADLKADLQDRRTQEEQRQAIMKTLERAERAGGLTGSGALGNTPMPDLSKPNDEHWRGVGGGGVVPGLGGIGAHGKAHAKGGSAGGAGIFAKPPVDWRPDGFKAGAPTPPPAPLNSVSSAGMGSAPAVAPRRFADDDLEGAAAAPSAPAKPRKAEAAPEAEEPTAQRLREAPTEQAEKKKAAPPAAKDSASAGLAGVDEARDGGPSQALLVKRAEQLFAARRWSEAIAAYRELLRRFPDADVAPKWKTRVADSEKELATERTAPATAAPAESK
ncbi:MAG TPA: zf-HC2 domain-containing protein [Polyangia bacterium]|nr:zf-HC2 domain-containing protein [Polyangia bacterium]